MNALETLLPAVGIAVVRPLCAFAPLPLMGARALPPLLQASLALAVTIFIVPRVTLTPLQLAPLAIVAIVFGEALIGLAIGLGIASTIAAARTAGELIGGAVGIGFAATVDPEHGQSVPTVSQFMGLFALALFMALDGPLTLVAIVADSYRIVPVGSGFSIDVAPRIFGIGSTIFQVALGLAAPVIVATLLVQIVLGVMGRLAPALNLLAIGLPATLLVGVGAFMLAIPIIGHRLSTLQGHAFATAGALFK